MATRIQVRRDSASNWLVNDPILSNGEIGFEDDTYKFKIGDGTNNWTDLTYFASGNETVLIAGESISTSDAVYLNSSDSKVYKADNSNLSTARVFGFSKQNVIANDPIEISISSSLSIFSGLIKNESYYLGSNGAIITYENIGTNVKTFLGTAIDTDTLIMSIGEPSFINKTDGYQIGDTFSSANPNLGRLEGVLPFGCDAVSKTDFAPLYAVIGDKYEEIRTHADLGNEPASGAGMFYPTPPAGYIPRPAFPDLSFDDTDIATNQITITNHKYNRSGIPVLYKEGSSSLTGLTDNTVYYIVRVDVDTISLALSEDNAIAGSVITLTPGSATGHGLINAGLGSMFTLQGHKHNFSDAGSPTATRLSAWVSGSTHYPAVTFTAGPINGNYTGRYFDETANVTSHSNYGSISQSNETRPDIVHEYWYVKAAYTSASGEPVSALRYDTGWIQQTATWTNAEFAINHNLNSDLSDLIIKFFVSSDGTEANAINMGYGAYDRASGTDGNYGFSYFQDSLNQFHIQIGNSGLLYIDDSTGALSGIAEQDWYYKVIVYKPEILANYTGSRLTVINIDDSNDVTVNIPSAQLINYPITIGKTGAGNGNVLLNFETNENDTTLTSITEDGLSITIFPANNTWHLLSTSAGGSGGGGGDGSTLSDTYTYGEDLDANVLVYVNTDEKVYAADEADATKIEIIGFTTASGITDDSNKTIHKRGELTGFTGLTIGAPCFWRNGNIIHDDDLYEPGEYRFYVGIALNATTIDILLMEPTLVDEDFHYLEAVPVGAISYWPTSNIPTSYLPCDGRELSREDYAELFAQIGVAYGSGDGSTTFNLPDFRGYFFRAFDERTSGNIDPFYDEMGRLRAVGEAQEDAVKSFPLYSDYYDEYGRADNRLSDTSTSTNGLRFDSSYTESTANSHPSTSFNNVSENETRAINVGLYAIIKVRRIDPNVPYDLDSIDDRLTTLENNLLITNKFDSGWIANSDWTNAEFTINHGLNASLSELVVKFFISTDGTDDESFEISLAHYDNASATAEMFGATYFQTNKNGITIQTGSRGIAFYVYEGGSGAGAVIDNESYYYRCVIYKPSSISYLRSTLESVGSYKYSTGWTELTDWTYASETITHNFNAGISDLILKVFLSSDGTDTNAFELNNMMVIYDSASPSALDTTYGINFYQSSDNSITMVTGANGLQYIRDTDGARVNWSTGYYKVVVYKPDVIQKYDDTNKLDLANADTDWHYVGGTGEPAFQNSWVNYDLQMTARFRKDAMGFVHIHGSVKNGTVNTAVFTLPEGYRPIDGLTFVSAGNSDANTGRIYIESNGEVDIYAPNNLLNQLQCSFYAEN